MSTIFRIAIVDNLIKARISYSDHCRLPLIHYTCREWEGVSRGGSNPAENLYRYGRQVWFCTPSDDCTTTLSKWVLYLEFVAQSPGPADQRSSRIVLAKRATFSWTSCLILLFSSFPTTAFIKASAVFVKKENVDKWKPVIKQRRITLDQGRSLDPDFDKVPLPSFAVQCHAG